ncbi:L-serine ammonia-lyase, partial [Paenirhodobacter enshiensis]
MFLSVFDVFKVGVGPSSSHTMGPMVAGGRFLDLLARSPFRAARVRARLYGSLAFTGKGHATDRATILGLAGFLPESYEATRAEAVLAENRQTGRLSPEGIYDFAFDPSADLIFDFGPPLEGHANGMVIEALDPQGDVLAQETYYSIGGGFVRTAAELAAVDDLTLSEPSPVPYPFRTAAEMLEMARTSGQSIARMKRMNERRFRTDAQIDAGLARIWEVMNGCLTRGLETDGILPGGLKVRRRAKAIHDSLMAERGANFSAPHVINDWVSAYAMAVNEENAAGGQVVTAPTNGAAGVVPAVIRYWLDHVPSASVKQLDEFLLTAAAVGG